MAEADELEVPLTMSQRMEKDPLAPPGQLLFPVDSPKWYDRELNMKNLKKYAWAAPFDPRFPQTNQSRKCFSYYVDYHRCQTLLGEDYHPCQFFKNVYMDVCPRSWVRKFDDWVANGKFPAYFDR